MKLFNLKNVILKETREEVIKSNPTINEGIVDKIISAVIDRIVKTKYKKYFDELHSDPGYIEALKGIKDAANRINAAGEAYEKARTNQEKEYNAYAKKYGKAAADKIVADVKAGTYRYSWKKRK